MRDKPLSLQKVLHLTLQYGKGWQPAVQHQLSMLGTDILNILQIYHYGKRFNYSQCIELIPK